MSLFLTRIVQIQKAIRPQPNMSIVRYIGTTRHLYRPGGQSYQPNKLEKKFLVWTGKYKSVEDVPNFVSNEVMERSRNRIRIRVANIMMALTILGCIAMVLSGKRAANRGESVSKQNLDWHKQYNEQQPDTK